MPLTSHGIGVCGDDYSDIEDIELVSRELPFGIYDYGSCAMVVQDLNNDFKPEFQVTGNGESLLLISNDSGYEIARDSSGEIFTLQTIFHAGVSMEWYQPRKTKMFVEVVKSYEHMYDSNGEEKSETSECGVRAYQWSIPSKVMKEIKSKKIKKKYLKQYCK